LDRKIVYPGQIPLETDLLGTNQYAMVGLGKLCGALFGTAGVVNGLAVSPNSPAALNVVVGSGEVYLLQNLEATPYSSLPADTTDTCVKQGIQLGSVVLPCPAPTTAGFSINYLIEATYSENDIGAVTLPYYNASNPTQAYSGPNNTGVQQATIRAGQVQLQVKAGVAASTGTQTTPSTDTGFVALAVVTVANGQTTIVAGNIVASNSAQVMTQSLLAKIIAQSPGRLLNIQVFSTPGTYTYTPTPGTTRVWPKVQGGAGGGAGCVATSSSTVSLAACGSSGSYCESFLTSGFAGATVVVGAAGTVGSGIAGGNGGVSSFGASPTPMSAPGGIGGSNSLNAGGGIVGTPPAPATGGNICNATGVAGSASFAFGINSGAKGFAAPSYLPGYGKGGDGQINVASSPATVGILGQNGAVVIPEYY
jgi:hypothetical protein